MKIFNYPAPEILTLYIILKLRIFFLNYSMLLVKLLSFLKAFNLLWPNILILYMGLIQFG